MIANETLCTFTPLRFRESFRESFQRQKQAMRLKSHMTTDGRNRHNEPCHATNPTSTNDSRLEPLSVFQQTSSHAKTIVVSQHTVRTPYRNNLKHDLVYLVAFRVLFHFTHADVPLLWCAPMPTAVTTFAKIYVVQCFICHWLVCSLSCLSAFYA